MAGGLLLTKSTRKKKKKKNIVRFRKKPLIKIIPNRYELQPEEEIVYEHWSVKTKSGDMRYYMRKEKDSPAIRISEKKSLTLTKNK